MKKEILFLGLIMLTGLLRGFAQTGPEPPPPVATDNPAKIETEESPKYEVQLQYSQESLTRNLGVWRIATLHVERRFSKRQMVWGTYRVSLRNSTRDQEFIAGAYKSFGGKWATTAEAMFSQTHQYVGKFSVMGEAEKNLGHGFVGHVGGRYTAYNSVKATSVYGLAEKYWGNNRAAYTLYITKLTNAGTAPTHRIQYNRYIGKNLNSFGAIVAFGREHENLGPGIGILRNETWSLGVSGRYWLKKNIGLNLDGTIHRQGNLYYRRGLNFGIRFRF